MGIFERTYKRRKSDFITPVFIDFLLIIAGAIALWHGETNIIVYIILIKLILT